MKILNIAILFILCFYFTGCRINTEGNKYGQLIKHQSFKKNIHITPVPIQIDTMIAFTNWTIIDSLLLVESDGTKDAFYLLHLSNLKTKLSFGRKGNGPNEYIMPHLVQGAPDIMILDNAMHTLNWLSQETGLVNKRIKLHPKDTYWQPRYFDETNLCFIKNAPNELKWVIYDLQTEEIKDSLLFTDETNKGNAIQYEFTYFVDSTQLVMAFNYENTISCYEIRNKKLYPKLTIKGEKKENKMYGTDVFIFKDNIYVLNQENINLQTFKGESFLDVYTKEGESVCRIHLGIITGSMLLDNRNGQVLFYSPDNENVLYSVPLLNIQSYNI